jgi:hypothetical protein
MTPTMLGVWYYFLGPTLALALVIGGCLIFKTGFVEYFYKAVEEASMGIVFGPLIVGLGLFLGAYVYDKAKIYAPPLWHLPSVKITTK